MSLPFSNSICNKWFVPIDLHAICRAVCKSTFAKQEKDIDIPTSRITESDVLHLSIQSHRVAINIYLGHSKLVELKTYSIVHHRTSADHNWDCPVIFCKSSGSEASNQMLFHVVYTEWNHYIMIYWHNWKRRAFATYISLCTGEKTR